MSLQFQEARGSFDAAQGAAVVMAFVAVLGLGLMGFATGYAKADKTAHWPAARGVALSGVQPARVMQFTPSPTELFTEVAAPAPKPKRALLAPLPLVAAMPVAPAIKPAESVPAPQADAAEAPAAAGATA